MFDQQLESRFDAFERTHPGNFSLAFVDRSKDFALLILISQLSKRHTVAIHDVGPMLFDATHQTLDKLAALGSVLNLALNDTLFSEFVFIGKPAPQPGRSFLLIMEPVFCLGIAFLSCLGYKTVSFRLHIQNKTREGRIQ